MRKIGWRVAVRTDHDLASGERKASGKEPERAGTDMGAEIEMVPLAAVPNVWIVDLSHHRRRARAFFLLQLFSAS